MTILFKYTPGLIEPETLLKTLMGRKEELRNINRILRNASSGRSLSHAIIIGPKGIGKTHLLRIIYHSVKGDIKVEDLNDYKEDFAPLISPEEEYVDSLDKFILLILRYLKHSGIENIPVLSEELLKPVIFGDKEKEIAISYIKQFKNKTKKLLLLLIDNINEIIENFTEEDQSRLREILMTSDSILLISTAPTIFDSITNHDRPLFNFFEIIWLGDLTFEESKKLLEKYAQIEGRDDLLKSFGGAEPKLKAIYELAGGNPRLVLSLYQIIAEDDITSVEEAFLRMVDELNPYFRERMKDITTQQREIIDAMAQLSRLLTPTEIASKCLLPVNVVNSQIKRLERSGYIEKAPQKRGKRVLYEIREKLFSIWRQMRVEAGRKRLGFLVTFYQIWYTKEELLTQLVKIYSDVREMITIDKTKLNHLEDKFWYIKEASDIPAHVSRRLDAGFGYFKRDYESVVENLIEYLKKEPKDYSAWSDLGNAYSELKKYDETIEAFKKAIEIKPDLHEAWNNLGNAYFKLKKYDEAIEAFKKTIEIKSDMHEAWYNLGSTYSNLKKYDEAIEAFKKTIEIKSDMHEAWYNLGNAYSELKKYDEATDAYKKAIEIKPDKHEAWNNLGNAYYDLKKYDEAIEAFKKATEIKPDKHEAWNNLGNAYYDLKKYYEAIEAFKKAIEIKPDLHEALHNLGNAYYNLKKYDEAIEAFKKAIEIKPDLHEAWYNLGSTYSELKKYDEAIEAYKKIIEIKSDFPQAWSQLGFIYPFLEKYDEAIAAFKKAIEIVSTENLAWTGLGGLYLFLFSKNESEEDKTASLQFLKNSLECIPHITEYKGIFGAFALVLKEFITGKRINIVKMVLDEIEKAGQKELLEFLSPYSTLIKYLETKDREIIDRLKREDRVIVEEMLNLLEGKTEKKKEKGKIKKAMEG